MNAEIHNNLLRSTLWDEAAYALKGAVLTGDFTSFDAAMKRFRELSNHRERRA